jgi:hypothetical protein
MSNPTLVRGETGVIAVSQKNFRDLFLDEGRSEDCDVEGFEWDSQSGHGTHIADSA